MKNIHLLPTDKPSRLVKNGNNKLYFTIQTLPLDEDIYCYPQNIYITSNEEIKEGDWVIKISSLYKGGGIIQKYSFIDAQFEDIIFKKIILTTDQDLIKDGVQAIDDEFLEWFVKNPNSKVIKIEKEQVNNKPGSSYSTITYYKYKIIIPQQEPMGKSFCENADLTITIEPQTSKEAAERTYQKGLQDDIDLSFYDGVRLGAKWQAKRMYSEEDMKKCWDACLDFNKPAGFDNGIPFNEFLNNLKTNKNY
jgi:hypothetical protein